MKLGTKPACFDSTAEWELYARTAKASIDPDTEEIPHFCDDCTFAYQDQMTRERRCIQGANGRDLRMGLNQGYEMATPEGRVKEQLKSIIRRWSDEHAESVYTHWPVLSGYGAPELDMNGAIRSMAFSIETKAPGEKPTKRQWITIGDKRAAGVPVLAFDGCIGDVIEVKDLFDALLRRDFQAAHDISSRNLVRYSG